MLNQVRDCWNTTRSICNCSYYTQLLQSK